MSKGAITTSGTSKVLPLTLTASQSSGTQFRLVITMKNPIVTSIGVNDMSVEIKEDTNILSIFNLLSTTYTFTCDSNCSACDAIYTTCTACDSTYKLVDASCTPIPVAFSIAYADNRVGVTSTSNHSYQINRDMDTNSEIRMTLSTLFDVTGLSISTSNANMSIKSILGSRLRNRILHGRRNNERLLTTAYLITIQLATAISAGNPMTFTFSGVNPLAMT